MGKNMITNLSKKGVLLENLLLIKIQSSISGIITNNGKTRIGRTRKLRVIETELKNSNQKLVFLIQKK